LFTQIPSGYSPSLGVSALKLAYKGSVGYLKPDERAALLSLIGYKKIIIGI
jgi:hypothetical protein